jgi:hypothetical protein
MIGAFAMSAGNKKPAEAGSFLSRPSNVLSAAFLAVADHP